MNKEKEYNLLDYEFSNGEKKLRVDLTYFKDIPKVDIREYYLDKNDSDFKPTKKGIQLDVQKSEALRFALEENAKIIDQHLLNGINKSWSDNIKTIKSSSDFFSSFEFYRVISKGSEDTIVFNQNHAFGKKISEFEGKIMTQEISELIELIKILLVSHDHSYNNFDENTKIEVGDFIQDQKQIWSNLIKRLL